MPINAMGLAIAPRGIPSGKRRLRMQYVEHTLSLRTLHVAQPRPELCDDALDVTERCRLPAVDVHRGIPLRIGSGDTPGTYDYAESS